MSFFKSIWRGPSKHKKLSEDFVLNKIEDPSNPTVEGVSFDVKYIGSTLVESASGEESTAEAIKTVITMAKASGKKLQRVNLTIGLNGIRMVDVATEEIHLEVSIYRISYCSADATYDHVFAFIATNANETMECHAFLCQKRKVAQAVTLTIAQSFNMAYELWQMAENKKKMLEKSDSSDNSANEDDNKDYNSKDESSIVRESRSHSLLIDLSPDTPTTEQVPNWVCFDEDDNDDDFHKMTQNFTRLGTNNGRPLEPTVTINPPPPNSNNSIRNNPWHSTNSNRSPIDLLCS